MDLEVQALLEANSVPLPVGMEEILPSHLKWLCRRRNHSTLLAQYWPCIVMKKSDPVDLNVIGWKVSAKFDEETQDVVQLISFRHEVTWEIKAKTSMIPYGQGPKVGRPGKRKQSRAVRDGAMEVSDSTTAMSCWNPDLCHRFMKRQIQRNPWKKLEVNSKVYARAQILFMERVLDRAQQNLECSAATSAQSSDKDSVCSLEISTPCKRQNISDAPRTDFLVHESCTKASAEVYTNVGDQEMSVSGTQWPTTGTNTDSILGAPQTQPSVHELCKKTCAKMLHLAQERVTWLVETSVCVHPYRMQKGKIPNDPIAAKGLWRELQAVEHRQRMHIISASASEKEMLKIVATISAQIQALDAQVSSCFVENSNVAQEELGLIQECLAEAREKAAPLFAELWKETKKTLDEALKAFEMPGELPNNFQCEDWEEEAPIDRFFNCIMSAVKRLLKPIGTPTDQGIDCMAQDWERAIFRVKAVDTCLEQWAKDGESPAQHGQFSDACQAIGEAWQTVALWISDEASSEHGLVSELTNIMSDDNDEESYVPTEAMSSYRTALHLAQTPWSSAKIQTLLTTNPSEEAVTQAPAAINSDQKTQEFLAEPLEASELRLQRLFLEDRHTEALFLAKHANLCSFQLKALIKIGTFVQLKNFLSNYHFVSKYHSNFAINIDDLVNFVRDLHDDDVCLVAKKKYLLFGTMLMRISTIPLTDHYREDHRLADMSRLSHAFMLTSLVLQPKGVTKALDKEINGPKNLEDSPKLLLNISVNMLVNHEDVPAALVAAHIICSLTKKWDALHAFCGAGMLPFQTTHPREAFLILRRRMALDLRHFIDRPNSYLLLDLAHRAGDQAMVQTALEKCEKTAIGANGLFMLAKYCLEKIQDSMAAAKFAQRAYAAQEFSRRSADLSQLVDFLLALANDENLILSNLIAKVKKYTPIHGVCSNSKYAVCHKAKHEQLASKVIQHLTHMHKFAEVADICLCRLQGAKAFDDTDDTLKLAQEAVSAAAKVDSGALCRVVAQIIQCVAVSFVPVVASYKLGIINFEELFKIGKTLAKNIMKKAQLLQEGILKIAVTLVNYRLEASQLILVARMCPSVANAILVQQMQASFQTLNSLMCTTNHTRQDNLCCKCKDAIIPVYRASATALYASSALSLEVHGQTQKVLDALVRKFIYKLKDPCVLALTELMELVRHDLLTQHNAAPFPDFPQPPADVTVWEQEAEDPTILQIPPLPTSASPTEVGAWMGACLGHLPTKTRNAVTAKCEKEDLDGTKVRLIGEGDLQDLLGIDVMENGGRDTEWIALRGLALAIQVLGRGRAPLRYRIVWNRICRQCLGNILFDVVSTLALMDSGILCSLTNKEIDSIVGYNLIGEQVKNTSKMSACLRALRNTFLKDAPASASAVLSMPEKEIERPSKIVVIGRNGAGKSTLLNALIGEAVLLPTNCMRACTSTIVELSYLTEACVGETYVAMIEYLTPEEWAVQLDAMCHTIAAARKTFFEQCRSNKSEDDKKANDWLITGTPAFDAVVWLRSVYGHAMEESIMAADAITLHGHPMILEILSREKLRLAAASALELSSKLAQEIDLENETLVGGRWPLIKRVSVQGPWATLMGGLHLVDAPGLHDDNMSCADAVRSFLHEADTVLLVSNIKQAANDKITKDLMPLELRRRLLSSGRLGQLAFVATHTDELLPSEIRENLCLADSTSPMECAVARNAYTKLRLTEDFFQGVEKSLLPINRKDGGTSESFQFPVFTVSSIDFQKLAGLRPGDGAPQIFTEAEATEIPALRAFLRAAAACHVNNGGWGLSAGERLLEAMCCLPLTPAEEATSAAADRVPEVVAMARDFSPETSVSSTAKKLRAEGPGNLKYDVSICFQGYVSHKELADHPCKRSCTEGLNSPNFKPVDYINL